MIAVVEQNRRLRQLDRLLSKEVHILAQHLNQTLVIGGVRPGTVGKKRKPQTIDCQVLFNPVGRFVEAKSVGLSTRITRILHRLRVDDDQCRPLTFF